MAWETVYWEDIAEGDELPSQSRDITATTIVSTAIASRDFQDVHHDYAAARGKGVKDIFLNILSTGGLVGKYITDWSGPEGELALYQLIGRVFRLSDSPSSKLESGTRCSPG